MACFDESFDSRLILDAATPAGAGRPGVPGAAAAVWLPKNVIAAVDDGDDDTTLGLGAGDNETSRPPAPGVSAAMLSNDVAATASSRESAAGWCCRSGSGTINGDRSSLVPRDWIASPSSGWSSRGGPLSACTTSPRGDWAGLLPYDTAIFNGLRCCQMFP